MTERLDTAWPRRRWGRACTLPWCVAEVRMGPLFRATIPFLAMVMLALVLIAAVPAPSTWLPVATARG